jgi:hypothetical protein
VHVDEDVVVVVDLGGEMRRRARVMPVPMPARSSTTTSRPNRDSSYAVERPAMPDPSTTTSHAMSSASTGASMTGVSPIQHDSVISSPTFIVVAPVSMPPY